MNLSTSRAHVSVQNARRWGTVGVGTVAMSGSAPSGFDVRGFLSLRSSPVRLRRFLNAFRCIACFKRCGVITPAAGTVHAGYEPGMTQ